MWKYFDDLFVFEISNLGPFPLLGYLIEVCVPPHIKAEVVSKDAYLLFYINL